MNGKPLSFLLAGSHCQPSPGSWQRTLLLPSSRLCATVTHQPPLEPPHSCYNSCWQNDHREKCFPFHVCWFKTGGTARTHIVTSDAGTIVTGKAHLTPGTSLWRQESSTRMKVQCNGALKPQHWHTEQAKMSLLTSNEFAYHNKSWFGHLHHHCRLRLCSHLAEKV